MRRRIGAAFLAVLSTTLLALPAGGQERPSAMKLYPAETLLFVRAASVGDLRARFSASAGGRMIDDPQIAPLVQGVYNMSLEQFDANAAEDAGVDSTDLAKLPQGEVAFGLIDVGDDDPAVMVLLDFAETADTAPELLDKLRAKAQQDGTTIETETVGNDEVVVIKDGGDDDFGYVLRDGCLLGCNDSNMLKLALARWDEAVLGTPLPTPEVDPENPDVEPVGTYTLAENANFVAIVRECSTQLAEPPQVVAYVDPIGLMRMGSRNNTGAKVMLAMLPALGIDELLGIGGTLSLATSEWDSLLHLHVLLENPRSGVMNLIRFVEGDTQPPTFVPLAASDYGTFAVDPPWLYEEIGKLVDKFRYEGAWADSVNGAISKQIDIDFPTEILPLLKGRGVTITGFIQPPEIGTPQHRVLALELTDATAAREVIDKLVERFPDAMRETDFGGMTCWSVGPEQGPPEEPNEDQSRRERRRAAFRQMFTPTATLIGNWLLVSTSSNFLEQCIEAEQQTADRLVDSLEYRLLDSRIQLMTSGRPLSLYHYQQPEISLQYWYDMLASGDVDEALGGFENSYAQSLRDTLSSNELPPFEVISQYLSPSGGFVLDTDTGFHYMAFSVARQPDTPPPAE